jgi:hypothetical protein
VGKGLERGDLSSAIEALSLFAPRKETTRGIVHRLRVGPATIDTIHQIPHILRENMLRLRDELIKIQQTQAC